MDIGHILSTMPPIVENIFKHLNKRELDYCSDVCELWKRVAETEKNRREDIACFFQGLVCSLHNKIHSSDRECPSAVAEDIESSLSGQFKELKMKPAFCLTFASTYFVNDFERLFPSFQYPPNSQAKRIKQEDLIRKRAYLKAAIHTAVHQYLPEKCRTTFYVAPGIIGCSGNSPPLEIESGYGISGILIPYIPGLQVFSFPIDEKHCDISKLIPDETSVKCLLIFMSDLDAHTCIRKIIQSCLLKENSNFAVGGIYTSQPDFHQDFVVAFCGQSVEAASVIINAADDVRIDNRSSSEFDNRRNNKSEFERKLKLFQETGLLNDRCFAFMFACRERCHNMYDEYNYESSVFHRLYPKVPLIGVFGIMEIGFEILPNVLGENQNKVLEYEGYLQCSSTVFVLVSVKL